MKLHGIHQDINFHYVKSTSSFNYPQIYTCGICQKLLTDAIQIECGCRYCRECIKMKLSKTGNFSCESCHELVTGNVKLLPDRAIQKEINKLLVSCELNCGTQVKLKDLDSHSRVCPNSFVICELCDEKYTRKNGELHAKQQCPERQRACEHCGEMLLSKSMPQHLSWNVGDAVCEAWKDLCPHGCSKERVNVSEHLRVCGGVEVPCEWQDIGCKAQVKRQEMQRHYHEAGPDHLRLMEHTLSALSEKTLQVELLEKVQQGTSNLMGMLKNSFHLILSQENELSELATLKTKLRKAMVGYSRLEATAAPLSIMWTLADFRSKMDAARSENCRTVTSAVFSVMGYRMCLRMYPCGDGPAHGTHVSLFLALQHGPRDDTLSWPFALSVSVQICGSPERILFRPQATNNAVFGKPEHHTDNLGFGETRLIPFTDLCDRDHLLHNGALRIILGFSL